MKITKIEAQVKTRGRYSVFVDGKFAFGMSELGLIESGLKAGQEYSKEELEKLKDEANTDKIYNMALGLIARRPRSKWEIENYLRRKEMDLVSSQAIITKMESKGFIDDFDFSKRWVENRRLLKPTSKRKLELELRAKRVKGDVIKRVLDEDEVDEFNVLLQEVEKKRRQTRYRDNDKLMQYLARQGYSYEDIKRALAGDAG